jgi:hypothetical protein
MWPQYSYPPPEQEITEAALAVILYDFRTHQQSAFQMGNAMEDTESWFVCCREISGYEQIDYRAPAVSETAVCSLHGRCFLRNPEHRPSAGDLADAFVPPSGARDLIPEVCEEMDRLNAANTMLEARLKATEALLAEERLEKTDLEAQLALVKLEKRQEETLGVLVQTKCTY